MYFWRNTSMPSLPHSPLGQLHWVLLDIPPFCRPVFLDGLVVPVSVPDPLLSSALCPPRDPAHLLSVIVLLPTFLFSSHFEFPKALFVIFFIWYSIVCLFQEPSISENVQLFFFFASFSYSLHFSSELFLLVECLLILHNNHHYLLIYPDPLTVCTCRLCAHVQVGFAAVILGRWCSQKGNGAGPCQLTENPWALLCL